jgi:hypothetical protein
MNFNIQMDETQKMNVGYFFAKIKHKSVFVLINKLGTNAPNNNELQFEFDLFIIIVK